MVLFLIGVGITLYAIREIVRLWHEPDNVHWVGPIKPEPEMALELEPELHPTDAHAPHKDGQVHKDAPKDGKKQRPKCVYREMNCTFEKPIPTPISCCSPLPSDQAKPQPFPGALSDSSYEMQTAKFVEQLPKEVRDLVLQEADKIEKMRSQSNALAKFVENLEDVPPPLGTSPPTESTPKAPQSPTSASLAPTAESAPSDSAAPNAEK